MPLYPPRFISFCLLAPAQMTVHATELEGCWRMQQMEVHLRDGATRQTNQDCVMRYVEGNVQSTCKLTSGIHISNSKYIPLDPQHLQLSTHVGPDDKALDYTSTLEYEINGNWLTTIVEPKNAPGDQSKIPAKIVQLLRRVDAADDHGCQPRGATRTDWGKLPMPQSAYQFDPPASFVPYLEFGVPGLNVLQMGSDSLFVGAYSTIPREQQQHGDGYIILMLEYSLAGPRAFTGGEFKSSIQSVKHKLGASTLISEYSDRAYFDTKQAVAPNSGESDMNGIVAIHHIHGRLLASFILARGIKTEVAKKKMLAIADEFAATLEAANP